MARLVMMTITNSPDDPQSPAPELAGGLIPSSPFLSLGSGDEISFKPSSSLLDTTLQREALGPGGKVGPLIASDLHVGEPVWPERQGQDVERQLEGGGTVSS